MKMSNSTYDILKWVALIMLPSLVTLIASLGKIWDIQYSVQVAATVAAIDAFLGACLQVSSSNYAEKGFDEEADEDDDIEVM